VAIVETPHDALFREAFGSVEAARGMVESLASKSVLAKLDLDSLRPAPGTFVDQALAKSQSDLLFSATLAGRPALVYFLLEHKSYPDRWVGLQLAAYIIRIWEKSRQQEPPPQFLPPVIPLVVHHGPNGWAASTRLLDLVDPVVHEVAESRTSTDRLMRSAKTADSSVSWRASMSRSPTP
jgi:predicted transposase YdaD